MKKNRGREIVVLVDNYDSPIAEALADTNRPHLGNDICEGIKEVVLTLMDHDAGVVKAVITGVNEFRSIFPERHFRFHDISMEPEFATVAGFTQNELDTYLEPLLSKNDSDEYENLKRKLFHHYYGYRFSVESLQKVYNPYSVICCLRNNGTVDDYWFQSGRPGFLNHRLRNHFDEPKGMVCIDDLRVHYMDDERTVRPQDTNLVSLMYYGGYYTLRESEELRRGNWIHVMPTMEVANAMKHHLPPNTKDKFIKNMDVLVDEHDALCSLSEQNAVQNVKQFVTALDSSLQEYPMHHTYIRLANNLEHTGLDVIRREAEIMEVRTYDTLIVVKHVWNQSFANSEGEMQHIWSLYDRVDTKILVLVLYFAPPNETLIRDYVWQYRSNYSNKTLAAGGERDRYKNRK